jgi:hypothetical protein
MSGKKSPTVETRSDPVRARAKQLRDTRVDHVADLMLSGAWRGTKTHRELAAKWEISVGAVADYAREASGVIRRAVSGSGGEEIRSQILAGVEHVRRVAMRLKKPFKMGRDDYQLLPAPDVKAALMSYDLSAKLLGVTAQMMPDWANLSEDEKWAKIDEAQARIEAFKTTLRPRSKELKA